MRNEFAIASLLLGVISFVQFLGIEKAALAIIFGVLALNEIRSSEMSGKYLAILGIILGLLYVVLVITILPYLYQYASQLGF